jgi:UDP-2,3-diacylglucosamine pyrophosphatase LpxH
MLPNDIIEERLVYWRSMNKVLDEWRPETLNAEVKGDEKKVRRKKAVRVDQRTSVFHGDKVRVLTDKYYNTKEPEDQYFKQKLDFKIPFFFWRRLVAILENAGEFWDACGKAGKKSIEDWSKTLEEFRILMKVERPQ